MAIGVQAAGRGRVAQAGARIDLRTRLAYGLGAVPLGVKDRGFSTFLLLFYSQVVGLSPALVGNAIFLALLLDAALDPVIGQLSDGWRSRWGRRLPFMYAAILPSAAAFWMLWNPPAGASSGVLVAWLVAASLLVRSALTVYEIPSAALSAELTADYDERTAISSVRFWFFFVGGVGLTALATLFFMTPTPEQPNGMLNAAGYRAYGLLGAIVIAAAALGSTLAMHRTVAALPRPPAKPRRALGAVVAEFVESWRNRSFLMVTGSGLAKSLALGVSGGVGLLMNTYFWELGNRAISALLLESVLSSTLAAALTPWFTRRFGKRAVAMWSYALSFAVSAAPVLLRLTVGFFPNGSFALIAALFVNGIVWGSMGIASTITVSAMIADVVEDSERRTGRRAEGVFFSAGVMLTKAVSGFGAMAAGWILAFVQFPVKARPGHVDPAILERLALTYLPVCAGLYAIGLLLMSQYRIDRSQHEANLAVLQAQRRAAATLDEARPGD